VALRKEFAEAGGFDPKASFAKRAALLRGRTIAVDATGSLIHAYVRLMAKRAGMPIDDVKIAIMQPPNMIAAFQTKQIDGFAMSPPWPLIPVVEGTAVMIASSFTEAEAYLHDHPAEALDLLKKRFSKLDEKVLAAAFETVRKISPNPPRVDKKGLENAELFNIDAGLMTPEEKLSSYDGLATDEFVK